MGSIRNNRKFLRLTASSLLVAGSVVGFWWILESSKTTESFLVTKTDLASGSALLGASLATQELALFETSARYLHSDELPIGAYLSRAVSAGELIPKSAVTTQSLDDWVNLVVTPSMELSAQIKPGAKVMVWAAEALDYQSFAEPVIAATDVEVVAVREPDSNFAQSIGSVELRVPISSIQALLRAVSNRDAIALTAVGKALAD